MRLNEIKFTNAKPIDSYGPGFFRIGGQLIRGGVIVAPSGIQAWSGLAHTDRLRALASEIDVLFIGTGKYIAHLPAEFRDVMAESGIAIEAMASPTACRTFNILLSEGRRIGAALLPVT